MKKGLNKTVETTSLLSDNHLLRANNFEPYANGVKVRNGIDLIAGFDASTEKIIPLTMASVNISGLDLVLIVSTDGEVVASIPERLGKLYPVKTRHYVAANNIMVADYTTETPPDYAVIEEVGRLIYILSPSNSWVIRKDGLALIEDRITGRGYVEQFLVVDALNAKIFDADSYQPVLLRTGGWSSILPEGEDLFYRIRNEMGGYGSSSRIAKIPADDSYLLTAMPGMRKDIFGVSNNSRMMHKILGIGFRTGATSGSGLNWTAMYSIKFLGGSENPDIDFAGGTQYGIVNNSGSLVWRNCTMDNSAYTTSLGYTPNQAVTLVDVTTEELAHGSLFGADYESYSGTVGGQTMYRVFLMLKKTGEAYLVIENTLGLTLTAGQYVVADSVMASDGDVSTTIAMGVTGPHLIKVEDSGTAFSDGVNHFNAGLVLNGAAAGHLALNTWTVGSSGAAAKIYSVSITGMEQLKDSLGGTFYEYGNPLSANSEYISYTCFAVNVAVTTSGGVTPAQPVVFSEKFATVPSSGYTKSMTCHYATHDDNLWNADTFVVSIKSDIINGKACLVDENVTRDILVAYYSSASSYTDKYMYHDIFLRSEDVDMWIAGDHHHRYKDERGTGSVVPGELYNWATVDLTFPVLICKTDLVAHGVNRMDIANVGKWSDAAYFNGKFYFAQGGELRITNMLLEWNRVETLNFEGTINFLVALEERLMVFADSGIYSVDQKSNIQVISRIKATFAARVKSQIYFTDENGHLYNTEFTPVPAGSIAQQTQSPYIIVQSKSSFIVEDVENWTVYDIIYKDEKVYVATSLGVYLYDVASDSWWRHEFPYNVMKFVEYKDNVLFYGGDFTNAIYISHFNWVGFGGML